jgi:dihydrofolate reductase
VGDKFKEDELRDAAALIFGRKTYDGFAAVWPTVPGDYAERMNSLPKYLASRTIIAPEWSNTSRLGDDLSVSVKKLKNETAGKILIFGSGSVCHDLMRDALIDEFSLIVYPVVLGRGLKLFPENVPVKLKLVESSELGDGLMLMRYRTTSETA